MNLYKVQKELAYLKVPASPFKVDTSPIAKVESLESSLVYFLLEGEISRKVRKSDGIDSEEEPPSPKLSLDNWKSIVAAMHKGSPRKANPYA